MREITIYSKGYCPYCDMAKNLLTSKGLRYKEIDAQVETKKFMELAKKHSHRTVPMVFIDGEFIGGFDSLKALDSSGVL